jgi:hypothetical protein
MALTTTWENFTLCGALLLALGATACADAGGAAAAMGGSTANSGAGPSSGGTGQTTGGNANPSGGVSPSGGSEIVTGGTVSAGGTVGNAGATAGGTRSAGGGGTPEGGSAGTAGNVSGSGSGGTNPGGPGYPYVFAVFDDAAAVSSLQIYTSNDALSFTRLLDTGFGGPTGNLRDPSIMRHTDGKYYVAHTTPPSGTGCCGAEASFSVASSADLKKWTTIATVQSGVAGVVNTWAPEWFKDKDGGVHVLVSVDKKTYRYEPTDATLTKFGGGTWIGIGPDYIDTFIVIIGDTYHAFTKRESTRFIEHATATNLDGPWTFVGTADWAKWGTHREAPSLLDLGNGTWRFYCDGGSAGHEMYSDSKDTFKTWTALKTLPTVGNSISHGTVIKGN